MKVFLSLKLLVQDVLAHMKVIISPCNFQNVCVPIFMPLIERSYFRSNMCTFI